MESLPEFAPYLILFAAGLIAGFVNAVAGGGSVVTIPVLFEFLDAAVANGTNRVAILLANITASANFHRGGAVPWKEVRPLIAPVIVGASAGALTASRIDPNDLKRVFAVVLILVALSVLVKPSRWVEGRSATLAGPTRFLVFLAIGFYGGFIQAGVGFLLLAGLVLGGGLDLVRGNAAKVVIIATYTVVALLVFVNASQVHWPYGLSLAAGNSLGALGASQLAMKSGAGWIRWVLVVAAVAAAARMAFF